MMPGGVPFSSMLASSPSLLVPWSAASRSSVPEKTQLRSRHLRLARYDRRMTAPVTQAETLASMLLAAGEGARFFGATQFPGLDCLTATFRTHVYAPHTHETYVVGTVHAG